MRITGFLRLFNGSKESPSLGIRVHTPSPYLELAFFKTSNSLTSSLLPPEQFGHKNSRKELYNEVVIATLKMIKFPFMQLKIN